MEIDYGMSSFIAKNKLPTLKPNSYLHTQASEIRATTKWSKQLHIIFFCSARMRIYPLIKVKICVFYINLLTSLPNSSMLSL